MFFRSVRFRLTLWYTLALAVILAASGLFWDMYLSRYLLRQVDEKLVATGNEISAIILAGEEPAANLNLCARLDNLFRRHAWEDYIQLLKVDGEVVCRTDNLRDFRLPFDPKELKAEIADGLSFDTVVGLEPYPVRMITLPVVEEGRTFGVVQVGNSLGDERMALRELYQVMLLYSPLVLLALALGGWFLAGRALSPMVRITGAARRITAENLSLRLPVEHPQDEIGQLAETFNAMLSRLESSFRKIKQFTGDASHELRTPLAILRGETEVSLRWARDSDEYRRTLESNLEEIDRMGRIIEDLLTLAKSDAGELPLEMKEMSLSDLLQEHYLQGNTLGESKGIDVSLHLEVSEEIRIRGDELRLRQMFLNLISNAIKYTPEEGHVDISLAVEGDYAVVTVADTGIGIPAEHLPHIFDRFYRIDKARNRADGGTGLGLAIVKWIAEAHQGRIQVTSTPGKGSAFTVFLPVGGPAEMPKGDPWE